MAISTWLLLLHTACTDAEVFNCQNATDCGGEGMCEPSGFCSFPDAACPSDRRYGELAGTGLANKCVDPDSGGSTGVPDETTSSTSGGSSSSGPASTSTSETADASTSGTTSVGDSSTSGDSSTGTPGPMPFEDDFDRPDDPELGNGWVEKNPVIFGIEDNTARITPGARRVAYYDNLAYRPFEEAMLDARVEVDALIEPDGSTVGTPQIYARVQPDAASPDGLTGYLCFIGPGIDTLTVRRQIGTAETGLGSLPSNLGDRTTVRLQFEVTGTDPVDLACRLLDDEGITLAQVLATDDDPLRIEEPGVAAFSMHLQARSFRYDNFLVEPL